MKNEIIPTISNESVTNRIDTSLNPSDFHSVEIHQKIGAETVVEISPGKLMIGHRRASSFDFKGTK